MASSSTRFVLAEVSPAIAYRSEEPCIQVAKRIRKFLRLANRKNSVLSEAGPKGQKDRTDLSEYSAALKDNPVLDKLEAESRIIRETARPRTESHEYQSAD